MCLVSVIIPNYNHCNYLSQRIESVLNQLYRNFEVIILDDCSTDNSREIIKKYKNDSKISQILYNDTNSGSTFKQWETGIKLAKGDFIWIAESDDWCEPDFLATAIKTLESNKNINLFFSRSYQIDDKNNILNDFLWWTDDIVDYEWRNNFITDGKSFVKNCLSKKNVIVNASAVVFRKRNMEDIFPKMLMLKSCGDWLFWSSILINSNVAYHAAPLNYFRKHEQTTRNLTNEEKRISRLFEEYYVRRYIYNLTKDIDMISHLHYLYDEIIITTKVKNFNFFKQSSLKILNRRISFVSFSFQKVFLKVKTALDIKV